MPVDTITPPPVGLCYLTQHMNTQFDTILPLVYIVTQIFYIVTQIFYILTQI